MRVGTVVLYFSDRSFMVVYLLVVYNIIKSKSYFCCGEYFEVSFYLFSFILTDSNLTRLFSFIKLHFSLFINFVFKSKAVYITHLVVKWSLVWFPAWFSDLSDYTCSQGSFFIGMLFLYFGSNFWHKLWCILVVEIFFKSITENFYNQYYDNNEYNTKSLNI